MNTYSVNGIYGGHSTPCTVLVYERNGIKWYCVEGSQVVNATFDDISDGVDVETLIDVDCFTWREPINHESDLHEAVEA